MTLLKTVVTVASAAVIATLAACGNPDAEASAEASRAFRVVAVLPKTGPLAEAVKLQVAGLEAGIDAVNAGNGIGGRKVELTVLDDRLDSTQAVSLLQKEINGPNKPDFVWAGATSNETLAMLPLLTRAKILSGATSASSKANDPATYPYHFGQQSGGDQNYKQLLGIVKQEGHQKVGFMYANDAFGTDTFAQAKRIASADGLQLVAQSYDPKATDLTAPMDAIRSNSPDVLLVQGYGAPVGYILDARAKLGWDVPVVGDSGVGGSNVATAVNPELLKGVRVAVTPASIASASADWMPATKAAIAAVKAKGPVNQLIYQALLPYDALQLVHLAATQAKSTDPDSIKSALETLETTGTVPWTAYQSYGYTATNHYPLLSPGDYRLVPAGPMAEGQYK